jgi:hypothetical protein
VKGHTEYTLTFEEALEAPQGLQVVETGPSWITLEWEAVVNAEFYMVQRKRISSDEVDFQIVDRLARFTNVNVTGLTPSTSYIFRVIPGNALNGYSSFSSNVTGTTKGIWSILE